MSLKSKVIGLLIFAVLFISALLVFRNAFLEAEERRLMTAHQRAANEVDPLAEISAKPMRAPPVDEDFAKRVRLYVDPTTKCQYYVIGNNSTANMEARVYKDAQGFIRHMGCVMLDL